MIEREYVRETVVRDKQTKVTMTCDICGFQVSDDDNWLSDQDDFDYKETIIRMLEGTRCHDYSSQSQTTLHICHTCFKDKLIPWVKSFRGAEPTVKEEF